MADVVSRIQIVQGNIVDLEGVDALVTAANEGLLGGGGVDGAIHDAAGPELLRACREVAPCPTGQARITPAFSLNATWVIHAVGPVYRDGQSGESALLASAYQSALQIAADQQMERIAFPCISTGVYGYPPGPASRLAIGTVKGFLSENRFPQTVFFCCFGLSDAELYRHQLGDPG